MRKSHFTLIELLIVIAVIVILMGIAIAVSGPMMAKAENNACASMIQKILGACEKFKTDFGAYPEERKANDSKTRDTTDEGILIPVQPRTATAEESNTLAQYLFVQSKSVKRDEPATWYGDYLDSGDIGEQYISTNTLLDYWQSKPLVYWLRYKNGNNTTEEKKEAAIVKKKLTPELWSIGGDGSANQNCLKLYAYPDLKKCNDNHSNDEDNVGGDLNTMKK